MWGGACEAGKLGILLAGARSAALLQGLPNTIEGDQLVLRNC